MLTKRLDMLAAIVAVLLAPACEAPGREASRQRPAETVGMTALDRYVLAPDDSFSWRIVDRREDDQATTLLVDLASQTWRSTDEVDRTLWRHWIWIVVPKGVRSDAALLMIGGGSNARERPAAPANQLRHVALATRSVVAEVANVPNQPLEFFGDGRQRTEDDLLARSWRAAVETEDLTWVGQLPMTKAAVRAMDAVQGAAAESGLPAINRFVVAGGSKRGWTTWLTAAVDQRVVAIAPLVIDALNIRESMRHHRNVYGFWSPAIGDYERAGLLDELDDPRLAPLLDTVDPFAYRSRLTMPKCIINASGDQFFLPDSSQFYFDALPGEKLLSYVPNAGHRLSQPDALETLIAFHASVIDELRRPRVAWSEIAAAGWRVTCDPQPRRALLWQARNPKRRDFRFDQIGAAFVGEELKPDDEGGYTAVVAAPAEGFAAMFVQLEFDVGATAPLRATTPVRIVAARSVTESTVDESSVRLPRPSVGSGASPEVTPR
ncbi:MAG: PhoPQ-activated pathogenicity-related family protein [Pirellulales bacterium]|nr:PhoPQ-activated pathogenicity-related family protein [Pirellulales bacterium]